MTERTRVADTSELPDGERLAVTVDGTSVYLFNVGGSYYALENRCAHQGGPVCTGKLQGALTAEYTEPGAVVDEEFSDTPAIACPWHGWEYDVTTGEHLGHREISLDSYDVAVEGDDIFIET